ncbi:hypothetical protein RND71_009219 [Anisodus tanguticus]|uniref:Ubiquitin-like domain-containing protein n=1 Tax=Anisodus tanguticus TaxID=243964 RepID=A0AAE1VQX2_9SOLA|nr:hypothetical protein RND71_009219 [Anisodus tanguticus]
MEKLERRWFLFCLKKRASELGSGIVDFGKVSDVTHEKRKLISNGAEHLSSPTRKIQLLLKTPTSKLGVALEVDVTDSIRMIKERIHEMEGVNVSKLVMHANEIELIDHQNLQDYGLSDNSEIDVSIRPSVVASATTTTTSSGSSVNNENGLKKLRIIVLSKCGTKKTPIEVNPSDNVGHLRKELQKLNQKLELGLPQEGVTGGA